MQRLIEGLIFPIVRKAVVQQLRPQIVIAEVLLPVRGGIGPFLDQHSAAAEGKQDQKRPAEPQGPPAFLFAKKLPQQRRPHTEKGDQHHKEGICPKEEPGQRQQASQQPCVPALLFPDTVQHQQHSGPRCRPGDFGILDPGQQSNGKNQRQQHHGGKPPLPLPIQHQVVIDRHGHRHKPQLNQVIPGQRRNPALQPGKQLPQNRIDVDELSLRRAVIAVAQPRHQRVIIGVVNQHPQQLESHQHRQRRQQRNRRPPVALPFFQTHFQAPFRYSCNYSKKASERQWAKPLSCSERGLGNEGRSYSWE